MLLELLDMIETKGFEIAGHVFSVSADNEDWRLMCNFMPFEVSKDFLPKQLIFTLNIVNDFIPAYEEELKQEEEGQSIICGKTTEGNPIFEFQWGGVSGGCMVCSRDYQEGQLIASGSFKKSTIDNALMVMFALATANRRTALFHAAAVSLEGKGYMFLGQSGTGKSTHARLWQKNIEGAELVNDDNPVVRIYDDGCIKVYGSPWSGKTPCYRNVSYPLGGIVKLNQASYNKIWRLGGVQSYAALVASISGKRWDKRIADGLHETENELAARVPVWLMDCLPDKDAAEICCSLITSEQDE